MSEPKITLATADYISIPDVNLLDANTAGTYQSRGVYTLGAIVDDSSSWSGKMNSINVTGAGTQFPTILYPSGITPGTTYTVTSLFRALDWSAITSVRLGIQWEQAAGTYISISLGSLVSSPTENVQSFVTAVAPALVGRLKLYWTIVHSGNVTYRLSNNMLAVGTLTEFVPSLDVDPASVTVDPSGMDVDYVKGTDLRIGDGWAGDAVSYERRDGTSGPVVAYWSAQETVDRAGLQIGDTDTYVGPTDGRTYTLNGADSEARWDNLEQQGTDAVMSHLHNLASPPASLEVVGALNEMNSTDGIEYRKALRTYLNII